MAGSAWPITATAASWPSHMASIAEDSDHPSRSAKRGSTSSVAMYFFHVPLNAEFRSLFIVHFPSGHGKPPARYRQRASRRIGIGTLQALAQVGRQPGRNGIREPAHQREPINSSRQEQIKQIANGIGRAFDNATADRIAVIGVPHHDWRECSVVSGPGLFRPGDRLI